MRCVWHEINGTRRLLANNLISRYSARGANIRYALNDSGEFDLTISADNPEYGRLASMVSELVVEQNGAEEWRGRLTEQEIDMEGNKTLVAKGVLDYAHDTVIPAQTITGSASDMFAAILAIHDSKNISANKKFVLGTCDISAVLPEGLVLSSAKKTWEALSDLVKKLGGYLIPERRDGQTVLHWRAALTHVCSQKMQFGRNLLGIEQLINPDGLATVLYAYGKKTGNSALGIESVNDGIPYVIDAGAVETFGWIEDIYSNTDCNSPEQLLLAAKDELSSRLAKIITFDLTAIDLADFGINADQIQLGDLVPAQISKDGNIEQIQCTALQRYLWEPKKTKLTLGASMRAISDYMVGGNL